MIERMWGHLKRIPIRGHLNSPKEFLSPLSLGLMSIWIPISYLIIFNWSFTQLIGGFVVDRVCISIISSLVLSHRSKKSLLFKNVLNTSLIESPIDFKVDYEFVRYLQRFPHELSLLSSLIGVIKNLPIGIYVLLQMDPNDSYVYTVASFTLLTIISMVHSYGCQFLELNIWTTKFLKKISETNNLKKIFSEIKISEPNGDFFWAEVTSYFTIVVSLFITMALNISQKNNLHPTYLFEYFLMTLSALFLLVREFYLSRTYFFQGMVEIFNAMNDRAYFLEHRELPLSSSELLAKFQQVFNKMNSDLREKVSEVKNWTNYATAKTRIQTLGETSAIVAHDLASPIHSMKLFMEELKERPDEISKSPELIERMNVALGRCEELILSLRSSLKNTNDEIMNSQSSFKDIYSYSTNSVMSLYRNSDELKNNTMRKPEISLVYESSEPILDAKIHLSRLDGIHIISNLFSNAANELIRANISNPFISVRLRQINSETIEIKIIDNGRGLTPEQFESLTSDVGLFKGYYASVGLHLIRKMIESRGGQIWVESPQIDGMNSGTAVVIRLRGNLVRGDNRYEENHLDT